MLIAFDSDKAGHNAALRAARIALNLGMDVKIADIEGGKDPADLVLANPENWKETLRHAKPIVEFVLDGIMKETVSSDGKAKLDPRKLPTAIREKVLPFIAEVKGSMERSHWIKMIHTKTGLSEEAVRDDLKSVLEKKSAEAASESRAALATARDNATAPKPASPARLDMVARKLFGILTSIEKSPEKSSIAPKGYFDHLREIVGDGYDKMIADIAPFRDELVLEAEITYGEGRDIKKELDELMINFEEDILKGRLAEAMADLAAAEREKDIDKSNAAGKLCHELSRKLEDVRKRRKE